MEEKRGVKDGGRMTRIEGFHYNFKWCLLSYTTTCGAGTGGFLNTEKIARPSAKASPLVNPSISSGSLESILI